MTEILKIAHRGASGHEPENTLAAFKKAIELGADMIELDIHCCKTGELIVMHDETVNRTTNGQGKISKKTLEEIKQLTTNNQENIPTLQEVINLIKGQSGLVIEAKNRKVTKRVLEIIQKNKIEDSCMVSSKFIGPLRLINKMDAKIETVLIFWPTKNALRQVLFSLLCLLILPLTYIIVLYRAKKSKTKWVYIMYPLAQKNFIKLLHKLNYKVAVWIVNKPRQIKKFKKRSVEAIISNYPDRL